MNDYLANSEGSRDREETISEVIDCVKNERTSDFEIALHGQGIIDRIPHELELAISKEIYQFEVLAQRLRELLRWHRAYVRGLFLYALMEMRGTSMIFMRNDAYRQILQDELRGKSDSYVDLLNERFCNAFEHRFIGSGDPPQTIDWGEP